MLSSILYIGLKKVIDDRSWMYQDSPEGLRKMDYYNGVQGFIDYTLSNSRNINGDNIKYLCKRCKNKKFLNPDVVTMHILYIKKKVYREIHVLICTRRTVYSSRDYGRNDGWVNFYFLAMCIKL